MDLFGLTRWPSDPFGPLDQMRDEVAGLFRRWDRERTAGRGQVYPPVNLYENEDGYVLTAEVPGVPQEDLHVSIEGSRVTLRGERRIEYPDQPETGVHRRERQAGIFRRVVELPLEVDADKTEASYRHGVLLLRLPKAAAHRPRQIAVSRS